MKEAFISGYTDATFILAPLAMKLVEDGVPVKIVYLGHRDGTALMVRLHPAVSSVWRLPQQPLLPEPVGTRVGPF